MRVLHEMLGILSGIETSLPMIQRIFLTEITVGIIRAQSCQLSEIIRALLNESDPNLQTHELASLYHRLDEELGKYDLSPAYGRAQGLMLSQLDSSCLFIFDPSEVVKPFGKKLEALSQVRDASAPIRIERDPLTGKRRKRVVLKPGYPVRVAVAMNSAQELLPLELSMYSFREEHFASSNEENLYVLEELLHRAGFQPTLVVDREFDSYALFRHLLELRVRFIIRVGKKRRYLLPDIPRSPGERTYSREEILGKSTYLRTQEVVEFTRHGVTQSLLCSFRAARVKLLSEDVRKQTTRMRGDLEALILVEVKLHKVKGIPTLYLLTSTRPITEDELKRVGLNYLARWNIEEYVRFLKQHFGLEKFLVRDLGRMRNLIRAVYIATVVLHQLTDIKTSVGLRNQRHLLMRSARIGSMKKINDFHWYAYARGLANVISWNQRLFDSLQNEKELRQRRAA